MGKYKDMTFHCDGRWEVNVLLTTLIWSFHHWLVEEASVAVWPKA